VPCIRCGGAALDLLCASCSKHPAKIRRIHVVVEDSSSGSKADSQPEEIAIDADEEFEDGLEHTTQFQLSGEFLCSGASSPRLLSQDTEGEELSSEPQAVVGICPLNRSTQAETPPTPKQQTKPDFPDVPLRVLYWNLERFGGEEQWGLKEARADEVMQAIADVIDLADPHFVVLVEVMAHKGKAEVVRLLECLNRLRKRWQFIMPEGATGMTKGKPSSGESYAVLYEAGVGIALDFARIGQTVAGKAFPVGTYAGSSGEEIAFRAPGEFLFRMGGQFGLKDGTSWPLGIVALHAPGPQANRERQEQIEKVVHDLRLLDLIASPEKYPDVLVCADFNSHPDAYNISKEPEEHFDIAIHHFRDWSVGEGDECEDERDAYIGDEYGADEYEDDAGEQAITEIAAIREAEARAEARANRKYDKRKSNKVTTRVATKQSRLLAAREQERLMALIKSNDLDDEFHERRTSDVKEWREGINELLDRFQELDEEYNEHALEAVREHFDRNPLKRNREDDEDPQAEYEAARNELLGELQELEPRIAAIRYIEDVVDVMELLQRPGTANRQREAKFKRELKSQIKTVEEEDKMLYREKAWTSLDPAPLSGGDNVDDVAWEGFFNDLSCDTELKTTRRRAITVLRTKGKLGKLQLPEGPDSLLFSKYDQILPRMLGHLREPDNVALPMLVAVLSAAANERLYGKADAEAGKPEDVGQNDVRIVPRGQQSALAAMPLHQLSGLAHARLKDSATWVAARNKTYKNVSKHIDKGNLADAEVQELGDLGSAQNIAKLEEADPPNFHVLQLALYLSRTLSDHDPMLSGYWVNRQLPKRSRLKDLAPDTAHLQRPPLTLQGQDFFVQLLGFAEARYQDLCGTEGAAHPLADLLRAYFTASILPMGRRPVSMDDAIKYTKLRVGPVYDAARDYCSGALDGLAFVDQPGGICNVGNSCYLNATLQVLASSPFYRTQISNAPASALKKILELVVRLINGGALVERDFAELLREALISNGWHHGYREQDPSELLMLIADELHFVRPWQMSQQVVPAQVVPDQVMPDEVVPDEVVPDEVAPVIITREHVFPLEISKSGLLPVAFSACYAAFATSVTDLQVPISRTAELINQSEGPVQIKRFRHRYNTDGAREVVADRTPLAAADPATLANGNTPLYGIILQLGGDSLDRGHYHAYVVRNGHTYCCSDDTVTDVTGQQADADARANGYMYFYRT
jgi:hypothetical protein